MAHNFFYGITGIAPGMGMRLTDIGSQYLLTSLDANKHIDERKDLQGDAAKDISEANFWSFTVYDDMTRSMLDTPQRYRVPVARAIVAGRRREHRRFDDGSTSVKTSLTGVKRGNWIQTMAEQGLVE